MIAKDYSSQRRSTVMTVGASTDQTNLLRLLSMLEFYDGDGNNLI